MDNQKYQYLRALLIQEANRLDDVLNKMKYNETAQQNKYSNNELSSYDNHPAELGTQLYDVELNTALKIHEEHLQKEIHDALGRMEDGNYGKCAFCGKEIDTERLEAIPYTRLCMECEQNKAVDPEILAKQRPNEELVIDAPFGRKYLNKREDDEYEGLDYLNDLVKYGTSDSPQDMGGYHDYEEYYGNEIDKQGIVDDMDQVSNDEYKKQLP